MCMATVLWSYEETYAPSTDITFVLKHTYKNNQIFATECIGWYHGGPDKVSTENVVRGLIGNKAIYGMEVNEV